MDTRFINQKSGVLFSPFNSPFIPSSRTFVEYQLDGSAVFVTLAADPSCYIWVGREHKNMSHSSHVSLYRKYNSAVEKKRRIENLRLQSLVISRQALGHDILKRA